MSKRIFAAVSAALCASCAMAFDENTLAFYPFTGQAIGSSAIGGIVTNLVDNTKHAGTITALKGSGTTYGTAKWNADAPGKYVFAKGGFRPDCIYTNPACVAIDYLSQSRGIRCAFDSLATELSTQSEWTVEWFWKMPTSYAADGTTDGGWFQLPLWTTDKTGVPAAALKFAQQPSGTTRHMRLYASAPGNGLNLSMGTAPLMDGMWHHTAIRYKNGKAGFVMDYTKVAGNVTMSIAPTNEPVAMRLPATGSYHARISCIRVTKKYLSPEEFCVASNDPDCYPRTAFHWSLNGEAGEQSPSVATNRALESSASVVNSGQVVMKNLTGHGTYCADTNGNRSVFCAELPKGPVRNRVFEGRRGDLLGDNLSSLRIPTLPLSVSAPTTEAIWTTGTKLTIDATRFQPVDSSFTMEVFAKMNYADWNINTQYTSGNRRRTTIMGMYGGYNYHAWELLIVPSGTGKDTLTLSAYNVSDSVAQTMSAAVAFSRNGWHHVAVTYDASTSKLRLYVDYAQVGTLTLSGPLKFGTLSSQSYSVGGGLNNHSFDGWVDEVRLVRECLPPEKFMWLSSGLGMMLMFR